jgi:NAD(P)-dependent dehydrogenase (short-subunit alcohol dehydrogenase family)
MPAKKKTLPAQKQTTKPGREHKMTPRPQAEDPQHRGSGKLDGKVALITGGDSGIGRAVAIAFAKEGADVAINYLEEDRDAKETQQLVEKHGRECVLLRGDVGDEATCRRIVEKAVKDLGKLDILVNNASEQHPQDSIEDITAEQLERTFRTNVFGYFFITKAALKHLRNGSCNYQHNLSHRIQGQSAAARLFGNEGCRSRVHAFALASAGRKENSCQCRRPGAHLDATDSFYVRQEEGRDIRQ